MGAIFFIGLLAFIYLLRQISELRKQFKTSEEKRDIYLISGFENRIKTIEKKLEIVPQIQEKPAPYEKAPVREEAVIPLTEKIPSEVVKIPPVSYEEDEEVAEIMKGLQKKESVSDEMRQNLLRIEGIIGEKWLVWVGSLVFAAGFGILLKYAFEQGWLNEVARIVLGFVAGLLFIGLSELLYRKNFRVLAQGIAAIGTIILYLTVFIAYRFYQFFGTAEASLLFLTISVTGMTLALFHNSYVAALLTVFGAFAMPSLLADPASTFYYEPTFFSYLLFIDLGVLYVSAVKRWRVLFLLAFFCTTGYFGAWYLKEYTSADFPIAMVFSIVYFALFSFTATLYSILRKGKSFQEDLVFVILNPAFFFIVWYGLFTKRGLDWVLPLIPLVMAAYHYLLAWVVRKRNPEDKFLYFALAGTATGLLTLPIPLWVKNCWITPAWGVEAIILIIAGSILSRRFLRIGGLAIFFLASYRLLVLDPFVQYVAGAVTLPFINLRFFPQIISVACFGLAALSFQRLKNLVPDERRYSGILWTIFASFLFWITNIEIFTYFFGLSVPNQNMAWAFSTILWSIFAWWFLLTGIFRNNFNLRQVGLWLVAATTLKIIGVDLQLLYRHAYGYPFLLNLRFISPAFLLGAIGTSAFFYGRMKGKAKAGDKTAITFLWNLFISLLFVVLNVEIFAFFGQSLANGFPESLFFTDILWSVFAFVLILQGMKNEIPALRMAGLIMFTAAFLKISIEDFANNYGLCHLCSDFILFNLKIYATTILLLVLGYTATLYADTKVKKTEFEKTAAPYLWTLFLVLLFMELNFQAKTVMQQLWNLESQKFALILSLLWFLYGFGLLFAGIIKKSLPLRISALSLFGVTLLKVFFVDLAFIGKLYKTIALLAIGTILLIGAYLYRKYRKRISEKDS